MELLVNRDLSEPFASFRDEPRLQVADGWAPWWLPSQPGDAQWQNRQPVFAAYTLDGRAVQQLSTPFGTHVAGLWQQVPTAPGNEYEFSAEGQAWSSEDAAPASRLEASDVNLQVGVDPTGGLDPQSPLVVWSEPAQPLSQWQTLRVTAGSETSVITVYLRSGPRLPKRQQSVFWRNAELRPIGQHRRSINIVGTGDTHIMLQPERPEPGSRVTAVVSSTRAPQGEALRVRRPDGGLAAVLARGRSLDEGRTRWRYEFNADHVGLYEIRFVADNGARLLAVRLLQVAREVQLVPAGEAREAYRRVYVLLPPTADRKWLLAAARGGYEGRFTIGFSADDAGLGDLSERHVLAVNPHHWPQVLTGAWFRQYYPGVQFTAVIANTPEDLEAWLRNWDG